jgi:hypothetical protein
MTAFLLMLVSHAGAWALALVIAGRFAPRSAAATLAGAGLLHALLVSAAVLAALGAAVYGPGSLTAAGLAAWAGAFAIGGRAFWRPHVRSFRLRWSAALRESRVVTWLAAGLLALALVRGAAAAWLTFPVTIDESAYHLLKLVAWVQKGECHRPLLPDSRTWFPGGMQFLQAWWVGFLRHDVLVEAASLETAFAGAAATGALARICGLNRSSSLLAAALFATLPVVLAQGSSAMNDLAAGSLLLAALVFALRRPWTLAAAALAIGVGVKPTVAFAAPGVFLAAAARRRTPSPAPRLYRPLAASVLAGAAVVGGFWYFLNWAEAGNPIHPVAPASGAPKAVQLGTSVVELFGPRAIRIDGELTALTESRLGWGWTATLAGLPAVAWLLWRRRRARLPVAAAGLGAATLLFMVVADAYNARFVAWLGFVPCLAAAALAVDLRRPAIVAALAAAGAAANLAQNALPPQFEAPDLFRSATSAGWRERDALRCWFLTKDWGHEGDVLAAFRRRWSGDDPVLVVSLGAPAAILARGDYSRRLEFSPTNDPEALVQAARELQCRAVFSETLEGRPLRVAVEAERRGLLTGVAPGWFEVVGE